MNLLNVAIVPTHGTFKFFSTNLAYRVFSTSTTRQAYRNRYNVNDHGHKKETIDLDDISRVSNIAFLLDWAQMSDLDLGLSGHVPEIQAEVEVVKIKNPDFSCWAWSTPWGHVLSLKSFCRNPVLSWAIRYSVFQPVKFSSSFEFVCRTIFSTFWHLVVKFGYNKWF